MCMHTINDSETARFVRTEFTANRAKALELIANFGTRGSTDSLAQSDERYERRENDSRTVTDGSGVV